MYTLDTLRKINKSYDADHRVTQGDVELVNRAIQIIESSRNDLTPKVGDAVEYTDQYGNYSLNAHIENVEGDQLNICERAYLPFVQLLHSGGFYTSASGGPWAHIPNQLKKVGNRQKAFVIWGHSGACGNGAVQFYATVNLWEYVDGVHEFTTKTHDKFYLHIHDAPVGIGYRYLITNGGTSHTAFKTVEEYQAWLKTFHGVEVENDNTHNGKIIWTFKQRSRCVPLEEYLSITDAVVDTELENACVQECKRIYDYDGTTVTTYLPYQDKRLVVGGKEYIRAYDNTTI
jgi:hypothetical protein